jgi:hypothetical protein
MSILDYGTALRGAPNPLANSLSTSGQMQGLMQNAQALQQNRMMMEQQQNAIAQQAEEKKRREMALQEGANLLMGDDYEAQSLFMYNNPEIANQFVAAMNFPDEMRKADRIEFNKKILSGELDPRSATLQSIQEIEAAGGDATNLRDNLALGDNELIIENARKELNFLDPDAMIKYNSLTPQQQKLSPFQQGTGDMAGFVFNPNTGEYTISEAVQNRINNLNNKSSLSAKDIQSLDKDFVNMAKGANDIRSAANDLESLKKIRGGAASLALVFKFMNVLDPGVAVQESDVANAKSASGVLPQFTNMFNQLAAGETIDEKTASDFVRVAKSLANNAIDSTNKAFDDSLDLYDDKLEESFKQKLKNKVPEKFDIEEIATQAQAQAPALNYISPTELGLQSPAAPVSPQQPVTKSWNDLP